MIRDLKTKDMWPRLLKNPITASAYEGFLIKAVKAANAAELNEIDLFLIYLEYLNHKEYNRKFKY